MPMMEIILKNEEIVNNYRPRHKERNHNIRMLEFSGNKQVLRFIEFIYKDAGIYLDRKFNKKEEFIKKYNERKNLNKKYYH